MDLYEISSDDVIYPRDADHRFRVYGRKGDDLRVIAYSPTAGGVGEAIVQIDEDQRDDHEGGSLGDYGAVGVLDAVEGRWILMPWHRPEGGMS